jgi:hypothetical protein
MNRFIGIPVAIIAGLIAFTAIIGLVLLVAVAGTLVWGFIVMLLAGAFWHEFGIGAPIGYMPSLLIGFVITLIGSLLGKVRS